MQLAAKLEEQGHKVALHDAGTTAWKRRFGSSGVCPDLLVETNPKWEYHEAIPALAIEAKMGRSDTITDVWDGVEKVIELKKKESETVYNVEGRTIQPVFYLFTNPCLLDWDVVTYWQTMKEKGESNCCATYFNRCILLILSRYAACLLGKNLNMMYNGHVNGHQFSRIMTFRTGSGQWPHNIKR